jgi:hypothetical protein
MLGWFIKALQLWFSVHGSDLCPRLVSLISYTTAMLMGTMGTLQNLVCDHPKSRQSDLLETDYSSPYRRARSTQRWMMIVECQYVPTLNLKGWDQASKLQRWQVRELFCWVFFNATHHSTPLLASMLWPELEMLHHETLCFPQSYLILLLAYFFMKWSAIERMVIFTKLFGTSLRFNRSISRSESN